MSTQFVYYSWERVECRRRSPERANTGKEAINNCDENEHHERRREAGKTRYSGAKAMVLTLNATSVMNQSTANYAAYLKKDGSAQTGRKRRLALEDPHARAATAAKAERLQKRL